MRAILDIFPMSSWRSKECHLKAPRADVSTGTTENLISRGLTMHLDYTYDVCSLHVFLDMVSSSKSHKFTGKERDSESGLDNFGARYFGSSMGRFMTPDWSAKPQGVPY